jgi:uncharacterized phage protein (TIGR02220 family)
MKPLRQLYDEAVALFGECFVKKETCKLYMEMIDSPGKIQRIVDDLNHRTKGKYTATSQAVKKHINARLREGYSVEDLIHVNEIQSIKWMGTPEEKYLRPVTLYNSEKFAGYLADWNRWQEREKTSKEKHLETRLIASLHEKQAEKEAELASQAMRDFEAGKLKNWREFDRYEELWAYCLGMKKEVFNRYDMPEELKRMQSKYLGVKVSGGRERKMEFEKAFEEIKDGHN